MPIKNNREYRAMPLMGSAIDKEKRLESDYYVEGYATTFNDPYVLFEENGIQYKEVIDRLYRPQCACWRRYERHHNAV